MGEEEGLLTSLLIAASTGDCAAFEELYRLRSSLVLSIARTTVRNDAIAEEVAQEVWLQVWRCSLTFDPAQISAEAWLRMLTRRRAIDRIRVEQRATTREIRYGTSESGYQRDDVAEQVEIALAGSALRRRLCQLSHAQRETLALAYYQGQTYRQISERLRIPHATAKSRGRDALTSLRRFHDLRAWQY